ncbi:MAG: mechanosensitive ion channel family protein [Microcoleaceae cyanobacterium MO_207.B10]|nr:mechanosensitive ion channel family protein [Microcoleaceae cyanobacterium MO_207.B10]
MQIYLLISLKQALTKQHSFNWHKILKFIAAIVFSLLTFTLTINQTPFALGKTSETLQNSNLNNLTKINSLTPISNVVYKPIKIDGREIFKVAAIAGKEISGNNHSSPLNIRVRMYENNLIKTVENCFDPDTLKLTLETQENQTLVFASDAEDLNNQFLIAITDLDAQIHGISREDLSNQIIGFIQNALIRAQGERQPDYLLIQLLISVGVILVLTMLSILISMWQKYCFDKYQKQQKNLENLQLNYTHTEELTTYQYFVNSQDLNQNNSKLNEAPKQQLYLEKRQDENYFFRGFLQVIHIIFWLCGIGWILGNFPYTRWIQILLLSNIVTFTIIISTYLVIKISPLMIDWLAIHSFEKLETKNHLFRKVSRAITFSHALKGIVIFILACIGFFLVFYNLNISIIPVLLGLGIIIFTISFGSHNLVRDVVNGILILLEDQYVIGDIIDLDYTIGYVEEMNLRMTQIRDAQGRLSTIPNSNISRVHNLTKDWSIIDLTVKVNFDANLGVAVHLIKQVANDLSNDSEWGDKILDSASILGVNSTSTNGAEIVIRMKTIPRKHWSVAREMCYRLKQNFEREGISFNAKINSIYRGSTEENVKF